jgi:hypothetical protein
MMQKPPPFTPETANSPWHKVEPWDDVPVLRWGTASRGNDHRRKLAKGRLTGSFR